MAEFLVEAYVPRGDPTLAACRDRRTRLVAEELTLEGEPVRCLHSIFVPEDETCFYLFEALSVEAVREAAQRASLRIDRIAEAEAKGPNGRGRSEP